MIQMLEMENALLELVLSDKEDIMDVLIGFCVLALFIAMVFVIVVCLYLLSKCLI